MNLRGIPLDRDSIVYLKNAAHRASVLERRWIRRFAEHIDQLDDDVFRSLFERGEFSERHVDFLSLVVQHAFECLLAGYQAVDRQPKGEARPPEARPALLGAPPRGPTLPRSLAELRRLYDRWRRGQQIPARMRSIAGRLKTAYLKRVQSVWVRHGEEFREGKVFDRSQVKAVLERTGQMPAARASTIVQTETTYYYNKARRDLYDGNRDITHYLFVALRDQATTKWCRTRQGVVFEKDSRLLDENTPPCHWNCRSELLPLSPLNPFHLRLIQDPSRRAENRRLEPLPKGWGRG